MKQFSNSKFVPLEGCRGIAALIVVAHHFFLGFAPKVSGFIPGSRVHDSLVGKFYFVFLNGDAAVNFFFVLSGFVLSSGYLRNRDQAVLICSIFKRWPRLALPVLFSTVLSFFIFRLGFYAFGEAGSVSGSPWLASFAYSGWAPGFEPDFLDAFWEGATTFFTGANSYNSSLWTMKPEFTGSIFIYVMAPFVLFLARNVVLMTMLVALCGFLFGNVLILPFVAGSLVAFLVLLVYRANCFKAAVFSIALGLYLLGYKIPELDYSWAAPLALQFRHLNVVMYTVGSVAIILGVMNSERVYDFLDTRLSKFLGAISFPLYLVHVLVICSFSSLLFVYFHNSLFFGTVPLLINFVFTMFFSMILAAPLAIVDRKWVGILGGLNKLIDRKNRGL